MTNRLADLFKLYQFIKQMVCTKKSQFIIQHGKEDKAAYVAFENVPMVKPLSRKIGRQALKQVQRQYRWARSDLKNDRFTPCTGRFSQQWGLPCKHKIIELLQAEPEGVLTLEDVDPHWYLTLAMVTICILY